MPHFGSTLADPASSASSGQQQQQQQQQQKQQQQQQKQQQQQHRESDAAFPIEELRVLAARLQVREYVYLLDVGCRCRWLLSVLRESTQPLRWLACVRALLHVTR